MGFIDWFKNNASEQADSQLDLLGSSQPLPEKRRVDRTDILDELNLNRPRRLGFGSLYPALNRLEKKGLVSWRWGDEVYESGGARRKYYKATGKGATELRRVQEYRAGLGKRGVMV